MRKVTGDQIAALDRMAMEDYGLAPRVLMENAGRAVAEQALVMMGSGGRKKVCVFCGQGNNAGDGFVAARHLLNAGVQVRLFIVGPPEGLKDAALANLRVLELCGQPVRQIEALTPAVRSAVLRSHLVIDAFFGVGLYRAVRDPFRRVIEGLNALKVPVLSVDIPSGLDATTGKIWECAVRARRTVTFTLPKKGLFVREGPAMSGEVVVADIGIPRQMIQHFFRR